MDQLARWSAGFKLSLFSVAAIVVGLVLIFTSPGCQPHSHRGRYLAEALNNARQVKFALDGFATDFDGHYPSEATALQIRLTNPVSSDDYFRSYFMPRTSVEDSSSAPTKPADSQKAEKRKMFPHSNDYFRQLFLVGETQSEGIFWIRGSSVASKDAPDDEVVVKGKPKADLILQPGDCHWAYMTGQTNNTGIERPLVMDSFDPKTGKWSPELWDRKVIILRVDSSAKVMRMRVSDNLVLDGSNRDILSPEADAWQAEPGEPKSEDPRKLLVQPAPAKR